MEYYESEEKFVVPIFCSSLSDIKDEPEDVPDAEFTNLDNASNSFIKLEPNNEETVVSLDIPSNTFYIKGIKTELKLEPEQINNVEGSGSKLTCFEEAMCKYKEHSEIALEDWKVENEELDIKEDLEINKSRKHDVNQRFTLVLATKMCNLLPHEIRMATQYKSFVYKCRGFLHKNKSLINSITSDQDSQGKCKNYPQETSDQSGNRATLENNIWMEQHKNNHCNKIVQKNSLNGCFEQEELLKCNECDCQTMHKSNLQGLETFQCSFKAVVEQNLKRHLLQHKNVKARAIFKCGKCDFQTIHKYNLTPHMLRHDTSEEAKKFKCCVCDFQFKHKHHLKAHLLRHNTPEDAQKLKCNYCNYKTNFKPYLKQHLRRHEIPQEIEIFKCDKCNFQTKHRYSLKTHQLLHKNSEEVEKFKCNQCDFQSIFKHSLKRHLLFHKNSEEGNMFECNKCDFKTIHKRSLKPHMLRHDISEEVEKFKCYKCDFQTKHKNNLRAHLFRHNPPEDVQKLKCNYCNYETIFKPYLNRHLRRHKNP